MAKNASSIERPFWSPSEQLPCGTVELVDRTDDAELLALIGDGDRAATKTFLLKHSRWAIVYAAKHGAGDLAEDVAQNVLKYMIERPPTNLRNTTARPYMSTAIKREVRRVQGRPLVLITGDSRLANVPGELTSPTAALARDEALRPVLKLVADLPTPQRDVLMLREMEGLTFAEIAVLTGRRESTERTTYHRVIRQLRRQLSQLLPSLNEP